MLLDVALRGAFAPQLFGEHTGNNGFQVCLLIRFECARLIGEVDGEVGDLKQGLVICGVPIFADQAVALRHDNLAGKGQVPVEPGVPEAASVSLDVQLVEAVTVPEGTDRGQLKDRRVCVTSDDLEQRRGTLVDIECYYRGMVPCQVVPLARYNLILPVVPLFELLEPSPL